MAEDNGGPLSAVGDALVMVDAAFRRRLSTAINSGPPGDDASMPSWANFLLIVLMIIVLYYFMKVLFNIAYMWQRMAEKRVEKAQALRDSVKDKFRDTNGYSWDYVVVFKVNPLDPEEKESDIKTEFSMRNIVLRMANAGLHTKMFYSSQHDEVFCKIRCPQTRLITQAKATKYKFLCDPMAVANLLNIANPNGKPEKRWKSTRIITDGIQTDIAPYDFIYANYDNQFGKEGKDLYLEHTKGNIFRGSDRVKLIQTILANPVESGGCGMNMHSLLEAECIHGYFPVHDDVKLGALESKWFVFWQFPRSTPVHEVRNYFGEKIGFLTGFLAHYTSWLFLPSLFGFFTWINVAAEKGNPGVLLTPVFGFFMAVWATVFLESWIRRSNRLAMEWGVFGESMLEQVRPEFVSNPAVYEVESPVNGKEILYFPRREYFKRQFLSTSASAFFVICVIALITGLFFARFALMADPNTAQYSQEIASILNAVVVIVMGYLYRNLVGTLNEYENHRTVLEFEDALVSKTFIVEFINTFSALFFIAFAQPFLANTFKDVRQCEYSCMLEVHNMLSVLFLSKLATGSVVSLLVPYIQTKIREKQEFAGVDEEKITILEREFQRDYYDLTMGPFGDFVEYTMQFAYVTMFISAYPLATAMALASNYLELRVRAWYFCHIARRPEPQATQDIGAWQNILELISVMSVFTTAGIVAFTSNIMTNTTWTLRIWAFVLISGAVMLVKAIVQIIHPRVTPDVLIQIKRNKFIVDKLFFNVPDDADDNLMANDIATMAKLRMDIRIGDDDPC